MPQAGRRFFTVAIKVDPTACRLDGPFQTDQETMADPTYVNVRERQKRVTIAVTRRSEHAHIVRVRGLGRPDKVSCIAEINAVELRLALPKPFQPTSRLSTRRTGWPSRYFDRLEKAGHRLRAGR